MSWFASYSKYTDEQLMHHIANNNSGAVKELYKRYNRKLNAYLFQMLGGDEEKAQDFLQEIFLRIIDKARYFDPAQRFQPWVFRVASNLCKNEYRHMTVRKNTSNDPEIDLHYCMTTDPDHIIDLKNFEEALKKQLVAIDPEHRETFLLRFQQNYSIKEISDILNCPQGTVKSRLYNTTRRLSSELKAYRPY